MKTALAASLAALALALPAAAQDMSKVEIRTTKLSDTVYMMVGSGGNLALSTGPDQTFLVDDQFAPLSAKITAAIAAVIFIAGSSRFSRGRILAASGGRGVCTGP